MRPFALVVILLWSLNLSGQASPPKTPADAFAAIEKWHGSFSITVRRDKTFPYAGQSIKLLDQESVNGSFTLVRTDLEGGRVWTAEEGSIGGGITIENRSETTIPDAQAKGTYIRTTHGSGSLGALLDGSKAGTFSLSVSGDEYSVSGSGAAKVTEKNWAEIPGLAGKGEGMGDFLQGLGNSESETLYNVSAHGQRPLPRKVGTLSGSSREDEGEGGGTVDFQWTVSPGAPEKGEMVLAPVDEKTYQAWIPAPLDDPKIMPRGMRLAFRAELKPEKGKKVAPRGRIDFYLKDVSDNPGTCCNYPLSPSSAEDLRFAPQSDQVGGIVIDDPKHAHSKDANTTSATVLVEATDTSAFGELSAKCTDLGLAGVYERTNELVLTIPCDDNHNHVADEWERNQGIFNKNYEATWDEDSPKQRRYGDGYTLYEEYRGFMTLNGFVRTDPRKKDLFVYDPDGLVKDHYAPRNPAELTLHYLDPTLMRFNGEARNPENRWVNFNSHHDRWYARQYALYVKRWTTMSGGGAGMPGEGSSNIGDRESQAGASPIPDHDHLNGMDTVKGNDPFKSPLKDTYVVKIAPEVLDRVFKNAEDPALAQQIWKMEMPWVVMHEVGHAIGLRHHAPDVSGGVVDCVMRYRASIENKHSRQLNPMTRFCREGEKWKKNLEETDEEGNKSGTWQEFPSDNCWGQVDVKSDP